MQQTHFPSDGTTTMKFIFCFSDETYTLLEKAVAERLIFENHIDLFRGEEKNHQDSSGRGLTCQLTIPRGYHFLYLPYALVVRKGASRDFIPYLNQR